MSLGLSKETKWLDYIIVLAASAASAWFIYHHILISAGPLSWDESAHALLGLGIAQDIQHGDWMGFFFDSYIQTYWPPLHSWLTGLTFLITGAEDTSARSVSLAAFAASPLLLYSAASQLHTGCRRLAGLSAAFLFILSPPVAALSALCMLEAIGLLTLCAGFLVYFRANNSPDSKLLPVILGIGAALVYFAKTNYGIVFLLAILLNDIVSALSGSWRGLLRRYVYFTLPMAIIFAGWFLYPAKIASTWNMLVNTPSHAAPGVESWLYYPKALLDISGSWWLAGLYLASIVLSLCRLKNQNIRFLVILCFIQFAIGQMHHTKIARHLFPILPAIFLTAGYAVSEFLEHGARLTGSLSKRSFQISAFVLLAALLIHAGLVFSKRHTTAVAEYFMPTAPYSGKVLKYAAAKIRRMEPALIIGGSRSKYFWPPRFDWMLASSEQVMGAHQAGSTYQASKARAALKQSHGNGQMAALLKYAAPWILRIDPPDRTRSIYAGFPPGASYTGNRKGYDAFVRETLANGSFKGVITIASLKPDSADPPGYLSSVLYEMGLKLQTRREFPELGLKVETFQR